MQSNLSISSKVARDFFPFFKVHEGGNIARYVPIEKTSPYDDPCTGIRSKDVVISFKPTISARIFIPKIQNPTIKLPILVYFHGGGFSLRSAFDPLYHEYISSLVKEANIIVVSVEYRLAPKHPIPACYDDSWAALQWVTSHANGNDQEPWLSNHGDLGRIFIGGDSAGANISYNLAVRIGSSGLARIKLEGTVLVHPYFMGVDKMWLYMCPRNDGLEDTRIKATKEDLARIGCKRVIVFVAGKDQLRDAAISFYEELKKSGWKGKVKIVINEGAGHVFHLFKPRSEQALFLMKEFVSFIKIHEVEVLKSMI
ncbi:catalytic, putative [Ricinus communis]|uniref:Catalytic, putative n=1 Tax=Ricinus communis TaxID=3988 RepID=B9T399_RICCO|nr:catalytic, putative [Ricinus communis]|eukprot:XP_002532718.1 2-hydroxyisoflavanone dehydratase [Ricinus communis]